MHSIRTKIILITIAAILICMLSVFAASYQTIQAENDRRSVEIMNLIGQDTCNQLEKRFEGIQQSVGLVANLASDTMDSIILAESTAVSDEIGLQDNESLQRYLSEYSGHIQDAFASVAANTHGAEAYYFYLSPDISLKDRGFVYIRAGKTGFRSVAVPDLGALDPEDTEHNAWYFTTLRRGRPSRVGPYRSGILNDRWIYSYLVPIFRAGVMVGMVGMDLSVDTLVEQVSAIQVYQTGYACLFGEDGRVIYHPTLDYGTEPEIQLFKDEPELLQGKNSGDALIRYTMDGEVRQLSCHILSNGMMLIITVPYREISASWTQLSHFILVVTVVVVAGFAVLMTFVMRVITNPLVRLTAASRRLADADYDVELNYQSRDEVGELTRAFVRMRDQLKQYIGDLNHRVNTDDLTGLPNIRHFFQLAEAERKRILDCGGESVMLYFNLIGLKHFNRQNGFQEGDKLICAIAQVLTDHYGIHRISRFNRDHFAVVAEQDHLEEKLRAVFQDCQKANGGLTLPIRVGIYQDKLESVNVSVACDRAKYASDQHKGSYFSGFYYFDREMLWQIENLRYIISHLDQALREHWVQVYYQPIIRSDNGLICDEEALSRWFDPERGMLSPGVFIPILENSRLIYKLDLYVLEEILQKMLDQKAAGITIVPHSLNLSRADFDACDIVEEVRKRVDASGIGREMLTIEVTESVIGSDFEFMKEQIERFQALGFQVWMDDFGSGYSSLDVLQEIHFDLIKFDMRFMGRFEDGNESRIILTELIRMAIGLGIETVCEGVETQTQATFLQSAGCTKLQGFHFSKAVSYAEIQRRQRAGIDIGYENPQESGYYETIGRVNLYDLTAVSDGGDDSIQNLFHTLPMGILEILGDEVRFVRSNQSYEDFLLRAFGFQLHGSVPSFSSLPHGNGASFMKQVRQCCVTGNRVVIDEQMENGSTVHSIVRKIGSNPVTGAEAVAVAVLSITDPNDGATYAGIAQALASDYYNIYYVDLDTEKFIEYSSPAGGEELAVERHGENFFAAAKRDTEFRIYAEDREGFLASFTKEHIIQELDERGVYTASYRLIDSGVPVTAHLKLTRIRSAGNHIIVGISVTES